jgi:hypothetical protein
MNPIHKQLVLTSVLGTLAFTAMVFVPAGTLHYWHGWAYLGTFVLASSLYTLYLAVHDPALLQRRMKPGPSQEKDYSALKQLGLDQQTQTPTRK